MKRYARLGVAWLLIVLTAGCVTYDMGYDDDEPLSSLVLQRLVAEGLTEANSIGVSAQDGVVTLRGTVGSDTVRTQAAGIAQNTPGVTQVINEIRVW